MTQIPAANAQYPAQLPQNPYAAPIGDPATTAARVRGVTGPLVIVLAARGGLPVLQRLTWMVAPGAGFSTRGIFSGLELLLGIALFVLFMVWSYRLLVAIRARGEEPRFTPGWAIGAWFIPVGNFFLPCMIMTDAWRRVTRTGAGLVVGWWCAYMGYTLLEMLHNMMMQGMHFNLGSGFVVIGWLRLLTAVAAYGLWVLMVRRVSDALQTIPARAPAASSAIAHV
jgi:hypothetical protein